MNLFSKNIFSVIVFSDKKFSMIYISLFKHGLALVLSLVLALIVALIMFEHWFGADRGADRGADHV